MLRALERRGFDIGSHTVTNSDLTSLTGTQALAERVNSKRTLGRRLGHPVRWLAYPFGGEDHRIVALARRAGYALAVTTHWGADQRADDLLRLHRYSVIDATGVAGIAALVR
jgi:peptidoglycan/xylan/chitin deacetylase (PgdA/CDA1 family)